MKNQNDMIFSIVAVVVALIVLGICWGTKRDPQAPAAPEKVITSDPALPGGDVVMANALPGAGSNTGVDGGGATGGAGRPGGKKQMPSAAGGGGNVFSSGASGFGGK
jgi:hypothetical protein